MENSQKMDQEKPQVLTEAEINQVSGGERNPGHHPGSWLLPRPPRPVRPQSISSWGIAITFR
jgi:hypothetical protein